MQDSNEYQIVEISEQPIPLCQLLKIANLVGGGGEAKIVITEGYVLLNNEVEYQKRKKVYENDIVEFNGDVIQVAINVNSKPQPVIKIAADKPVKKASNNQKKQKKSNAITTNNKQTVSLTENEIAARPHTGRKPISF
ncbi:MAG: RNA-binding S4 domain-containing protein [Colwellia sp.]|nr:RNA-binding S4 domain-containing protein [Colwellia sp.]